MTNLTPGMRVEVVSVYADLPATTGPPEAGDDWQPYTGPGTWLMYGFTGGRTASQGPYSDLCVCNECATDPVNVEPLRQKAIRNLSREDAGLFVRCTRATWSCRGCGRQAEGEPRRC